MLNVSLAIEGHAHDIESRTIPRCARCVQIGGGGAHQVFALLPIHRSIGRTELVGRAGLYLDEDNRFSITRDQIEFHVRAAQSQISGNNRVALRL